MLKLKGGGIDLERSFSCGQAFRWQKVKAEENCWRGVVKDRCATIRKEGEILYINRPEEEEEDWTHYLSLDLNYGELEGLLGQNPKTQPCVETSAGIRLLRQDPFETTISFIVSANNNVKRIAGILERLSEHYGDKREDEDGYLYAAFPSPEQLAAASAENLKDLGAGYRAAYIQGAAEMVANGFDLETLRGVPAGEASKALQSLPGVGPKVASCIMLFALDFTEECPLDVWMKRVLRDLYAPLGEKEAVAEMARQFGPWTGAAQQYLFHYARTKSGK